MQHMLQPLNYMIVMCYIWVLHMEWSVLQSIPNFCRDKERGVVWEECIIMMPKQARFVFLSATIPNAREFADWIAKIHRCG